MNNTLLDALCCLRCHAHLTLTVRDQKHEDPNAAVDAASAVEVITAVAKCSCGAAYPVIDGVPRMLEDGLSAYPEFAQCGLGTPIASVPTCKPRTAAVKPNDDYDYIRQSFSREWSVFDYDCDKTWGWSLEERKAVFLADMNLRAADVKGKRLLDAGCGNGTLTAALASLGMEVVGADLNDHLGTANRYKARYAKDDSDHVQFVQANLLQPPFRAQSFDLLYSSGVIHHTPNSKETFKRLVPLVKPNGRLYVWVYGRRNIIVRIFSGTGRQLKRFMSLQSLMAVCRLTAPLYKLCATVLSKLGIMPFRKRTVREITLDLFDAWAPRYNHWHTQPEVQSWFQEMGFTNITVSGKQKHGFGVYGDRL